MFKIGWIKSEYNGIDVRDEPDELWYEREGRERREEHCHSHTLMHYTVFDMCQNSARSRLSWSFTAVTDIDRRADKSALDWNAIHLNARCRLRQQAIEQKECDMMHGRTVWRDEC